MLLLVQLLPPGNICLGPAIPPLSLASYHDKLAEATELRMVKPVPCQLAKDKNQTFLLITFLRITPPETPGGVWYCEAAQLLRHSYYVLSRALKV